MGRAKSTRVRVYRPENATDGFSIVSRDLQRGKGIFTGWTGDERILLICGLGCKDGWETDMEEIDKWLEHLGRNRREALRRVLRERGHMTLRPIRIPDGPDAGMLGWEVGFHLEPLPPDQRDRLQDRKPRPERAKPVPPQLRNDVSAGVSTPPDPGHGKDQPGSGVSAGVSTPRHAGPGGAGPGGAGPGSRGIGPYIGELKEETKTPPLESNSLPAVADLEGGGDFPEPTPQPSPADPMEQALAWFAWKRPDWRSELVRQALVEAMNAGLGDLDRCKWALRQLAEGKYDTDGPTGSPMRLVANCPRPWFNSPPPVAPAQRVPEHPRCGRCGQRGEPRSEGCSQCSEQTAAAQTEAGASPVHPSVAAAYSDAVAAAARRPDGPWARAAQRLVDEPQDPKHLVGAATAGGS